MIEPHRLRSLTQGHGALAIGLILLLGLEACRERSDDPGHGPDGSGGDSGANTSSGGTGEGGGGTGTDTSNGGTGEGGGGTGTDTSSGGAGEGGSGALPDQGWGEPEPLEDNPGTIPGPLHAAVDQRGDVVVVWDQVASGRADIWSNRYQPETGWGEATRIGRSADGSDTAPRVAVDDSGAAVAVWTHTPGDSFSSSAWSSRYLPETGWQEPMLIAESNESSVNEPVVALNSSGQGVVAWIQPITSPKFLYELRAKFFGPESGFSSPASVQVGSEAAIYAPAVAIDAQGHVWAAWLVLDNEAQAYDLLTARGSLEQGWEQPYTAATDISAGFILASNEAGNTVIVWQDAEGRLWLASETNGAFGEGEELGTCAERGCLGAGMDACLDADGVATLVFNAVDDSGQFGVWSAQWSTEYGFSQATSITQNEGNQALNPQASCNPSGGVLAGWTENKPGDEVSVWASRMQAKNRWEPPELVEHREGPLTGAVYVDVALDDQGSSTVVWTQADDAGMDHAWGNRR